MRGPLLLLSLLLSQLVFSINPPVLVNPGNGSANTPVQLTLDWSTVSGNAGYLYELDTVPSFNSPNLLSSSTASNSSAATVFFLRFGTTYYWRAASRSAVDTSAWTPTWSFTTTDFVTNVVPSNGSANTPVQVTLDWAGITGNTGYVYQLDTVPGFNSPGLDFGSTGTNQSAYVASFLRFGTTYYWRAAARSVADTSGWGATWSFTTTDAATLVSPSNGASNLGGQVTLDWNGVTGNTGYLYEYDTVPSFNSPALEQGTRPTNASSATVPNLRFGTTYYWRAAVLSASDTSGWSQTWSFSTANRVSHVSPSNGALVYAAQVNLDWNFISGATGYVYQFDTVPSFNSPLLGSGTSNVSDADASPLRFGTTYYWRVAAYNGVDTSAWSIPWTFTTRDDLVNTSPTNGVTMAAVSTTLDWTGMVGAVNYIYEYDTLPGFNSPAKVQGNSAGNSSQAAISDLLFGTTYYWRAAAVSPIDTSGWGPTWSFSTRDFLVLTSPSNGATNMGVIPTLDWGPYSGVTGYIYEYDTLPSFNSPGKFSGTSPSTSSQAGTSNLRFGTTYYWRAAAFNAVDTSAWSQSWSFTTGDGVNNVSPSNSATNVSLNPTIDWSVFSGNIDYLYEVDTDPAFNSPSLLTGVTNPNTSQASLSNLSYGTTYYWHAAVRNAVDTSMWGPTWSFTTLYQITAAPSLVAPANGSTQIPVSGPNLTWNGVPIASSYLIQYSTSPSFSSNVSNLSTSNLNIPTGALASNQTYYWRVRGFNGSGNSPWSPVWSFTTACVANASFSPSATTVCAGETVAFSNSSTGGGSFNWSVDGSFFSSQSDPSFTFSTAGSYQISLVQSGQGCSDSASATITVVNSPNLTVNASSTVVCDGESVVLTGAGASTYSWTGGVINGQPFVPSATSTYTVIGTASGGCSDTAQVSVVVNPRPIVAANASADTICQGETVVLTGSGASSYVWFGAVVNGQAFAPATTASYSVIGTNANGCSDTASTSVFVTPAPQVSINASATAVCFGESLTLTATGANTYNWTGGVVNGQSFTPVASTTFTVVGSNSNGCNDTAQVSITVSPFPTVAANASATSICAGESVTLTGSGANSYSWSGGVTNGLPFAPLGTASYTVIGTNPGGCSDTAQVTVTVNPGPAVSANASATAICAGESVTLTGSGASSYVWSGGVVNGQPFSPVATSTYTVIGSNAAGCTDTAQVSVTVNPQPAVSANASAATVCFGESVTLTGSGANSYVWSAGVVDGQPFVPVATQTYTVVGTNAGGCSDTAQVTVAVVPFPTVSANASATSICAGESVTLTGSGASNYVWSGGVVDGQAFVPAGTATYTVIGSNAAGCSDTAQVTVAVNPLPNVGANASATDICAGEAVVLTGSGASSYAWSGGVVDGQSFVPASTATYTVTGTDAAGCSATDQVTIVVTVVDTSVTLQNGVLTANQANASYNWIDCGNGNTPVGETGASWMPSSSGSYAVVVTVGNCSDTSGCRTVTVVGREDVEQDLKMDIYPNPSLGDAFLLLGRVVDAGSYEVVDGYGRAVLRGDFEASKRVSLPLASLPAGMYYLRVRIGEWQRSLPFLRQ